MALLLNPGDGPMVFQFARSWRLWPRHLEPSGVPETVRVEESAGGRFPCWRPPAWRGVVRWLISNEHKA